MAKKFKVTMDYGGDLPLHTKGNFSSVEIDDQSLKVNENEVIVPFNRLICFETFEDEEDEG
jgi:hypothetical protein